METLILVIFAVIGLLLAFWATMKPIMDDSRIRGKVLNFDQGMKNYYFRLPGSEEQLREALRTPPETKPLDYSLPTADQIRFFAGGTEADYRLCFAEAESGTWLRLSRVAAEREKGNIPYLINLLLIGSFGAKAVDYREAESIFTEEEQA